MATIRQRRPVVLKTGETVTIETARGTVSVTAYYTPGGAFTGDTTPGLVTVEMPPHTTRNARAASLSVVERLP